VSDLLFYVWRKQELHKNLFSSWLEGTIWILDAIFEKKKKGRGIEGKWISAPVRVCSRLHPMQSFTLPKEKRSECQALT
jgi:hypothetical protein